MAIDPDFAALVNLPKNRRASGGSSGYSKEEWDVILEAWSQMVSAEDMFHALRLKKKMKYKDVALFKQAIARQRNARKNLAKGLTSEGTPRKRDGAAQVPVKKKRGPYKKRKKKS